MSKQNDMKKQREWEKIIKEFEELWYLPIVQGGFMTESSDEDSDGNLTTWDERDLERIKLFIRKVVSSSHAEGRREERKLVFDEMRRLEEQSGEVCAMTEGADKQACEEASTWQYVCKTLLSLLEEV